jgi:hypothetical protein
VEKGMVEIETKNRFDFDHDASRDRFRQQTLSLGYGLTDWWGIELEGEWEKETGRGYSHTASEIENTFQFTESGEYWLDVGARLNYEFSHEHQHPDELSAQLLLEKQLGKFVHTVNVNVERDVGDYRDNNPELSMAWKSEYLYTAMLNPGFEYYATIGRTDHTGNFDAQEHRFGPALYGKLPGGFKYELGWLFGISQRTEDHTLKLNLEYEFPL